MSIHITMFSFFSKFGSFQSVMSFSRPFSTKSTRKIAPHNSSTKPIKLKRMNVRLERLQILLKEIKPVANDQKKDPNALWLIDYIYREKELKYEIKALKDEIKKCK